MTDVVDSATRSRMMSGIRGKNTKPEVVVRKFLHNSGLRYRLHCRDLPGKPDLVLPKYRSVVFVHGCFWHRHPNCRYAATPKKNAAFWKTKLDSNVARDSKVLAELALLGWHCKVVWECEISDAALARLVEEIRNEFSEESKLADNR